MESVAALTVADPVTGDVLLKGERTILFFCHTVFCGKGAHVAEAEGIVGSMSPFPLPPRVWRHARGIHLVSSLLWASSSGPVATLALGPDPLPSADHMLLQRPPHSPACITSRPSKSPDWLLCPSSGSRSWMKVAALKCEFINKVLFLDTDDVIIMC